MNRVGVLGFLAGALACIALAVPTSALAGVYTWDLSSDFTTTAPGANPDHDSYGGAPWSYDGGPSSDPSTFSRLAPFSSPSGGLATWGGGGASAVVGDNPSSGSLPYGSNATIPTHQVFVQPGSGGQVAAVGWTSPFGETQSVSINGAVGDDSTCGWGIMWTLEDDGTTLASGTGSFSFSTSASVAPGASLFLVIAANNGNPSCDATAVSLTIEATGAAPAPTVTSPATNSSTALTMPTLSGAAGGDFGDSSQVTVRVYSGNAASGSPVQTATVARSGATWSASLAAALPLGTYTAQAEQDDLVGDVGLSAPVTFSVRVPSISLNSLGGQPLATSTPSFTGTADTSPGADPYAVVVIYAGSSATGTPTRTLTASFAPSGQYSVPASPALGDGVYTAVAEQADAGGHTGLSAPQSFSVDTQAPAVTLLSPKKGLRADVLQLVFSGAAGTEPFDTHLVTVSLYRGKKASGKRLGTVQATVSGSTWSATWTKALRPAVYTAVASQTDAVGHVGVSVAHTFTVLALPPVIGRTATLSKAGSVSVKISCNERPGDTCSGTVLVLTRDEYQPVAGGPVGRLTVLFAYVHVPGGTTSRITRKALASVAGALRGHANVGVTVTANLHPKNGKAIHATARDSLRRG